MRSRRITTLTILTTAAALIAVPSATQPASAGRPGDAIVGDFNNDDIPDLAVTGSVNPGLCSIIVQYGTGPGVYQPPIAFTYLRPGGEASDCPDIGTAFDEDGDLMDELWLGWSSGPPAGLNYNRVIVDHNFRVVSTFTSPITPVFLGNADFSGDGVPTPYSYGHGGFATYVFINGVGQLGPEQWCTAGPPTVQLQDFNGNRAMDGLVSYTDGCADGGSGVVVVLDDGTAQQLEFDPRNETVWRVRLLDANSDRNRDIWTENTATGEVNHFLGRGDGTFVRGPKANTDRVTLPTNRPIAIDVLANDWVSSNIRLVISSPPRYGRVQVLTDRRILYSPNPTHGRTDRFTYTVIRDDRRSSAVVYLSYPREP
ncbi:Ig-like domain-containing protein [Plantactinospora sp. B5E13]|uniref:Ig-like domain-containing protein n=1 Tax=Plantactinospora sp. B5E13 TaxID=3153758 RepID=UPI00325D56CF